MSQRLFRLSLPMLSTVNNTALKHGLYHSCQLDYRVRLMKERSEAVLPELLKGLGVTESARKDHRNVRTHRSQVTQSLLTAHDRHGEVEEHKRDFAGPGPEQVHGGAAIIRDEHRVPIAL